MSAINEITVCHFAIHPENDEDIKILEKSVIEILFQEAVLRQKISRVRERTH